MAQALARWAGLGDDPPQRGLRAGAGVNIVRYKVWAFTLAGFLAGVAGALLCGLVGQMDQTAFPASESVLLFSLTVIGGAAHWAGPIVAGLLLRAFPALLNDFGINGNIATMIFGAACCMP